MACGTITEPSDGLEVTAVSIIHCDQKLKAQCISTSPFPGCEVMTQLWFPHDPAFLFLLFLMWILVCYDLHLKKIHFSCHNLQNVCVVRPWTQLHHVVRGQLWGRPEWNVEHLIICACFWNLSKGTNSILSEAWPKVDTPDYMNQTKKINQSVI